MTNDLGQPDAWLFRFRWILPLILFPLAILAAFQADETVIRLGRSLHEGWEGFCLVLAFSGLLVRALAVGFPERGAGRRVEDGKLPSTGIYSIVRYPLYLGTYLSLFGLSLLPGAVWFVLATSIVFFVWYGRIVHQTERALEKRFGDAYREWAARIPMFVPNPFLWERPRAAFSLRSALRRERDEFYFVVAAFVGLELACDLLGERESFDQWLREDLHWALLLLTGTLLYLTFRSLRPHAEGVAQALPAAGAPTDALAPVGARGPATRGLRVDGRVRSVDVLENLLSGGNLDRILLATLSAADLRPGERLVDVGCGSGMLATLASTLLPDGSNPVGEIIGIDATPGMIDLARERARRTGSSALFQIGTAEALPLSDGSVSAVTSSYLFHHLPSDLKRQVLHEMWRILKPGGRLVVTDYARPVNLVGFLASFPMRFDYAEYVRCQLAGELEQILKAEALGRVEVVRVFLGYITVFRIVKPSGPEATDVADKADQSEASRS